TNTTVHIPSQSLYYYSYANHRQLHSFPTRRSSDLATKTPKQQQINLTTYHNKHWLLPLKSLPPHQRLKTTNRKRCCVCIPSVSPNLSLSHYLRQTILRHQYSTQYKTQNRLTVIEIDLNENNPYKKE